MSHLFGKRANSTLYSIKCSLNCQPLQAVRNVTDRSTRNRGSTASLEILLNNE